MRPGAPLLVVLVALTAVAAPGLAQNRPPPAGPPGSAADSLPSVSDLVNAVDKATGPQAASKGKDWSAPVKLAVVFAGLALLPSLLVMMTSFTRIVIVLSFLRRALTTQNIPPTIAIIGLSLFLTIFTMSPTLARINQQAVQPYLQDKLALEGAIDKGSAVLKEFMLRQTRSADLTMFLELAGVKKPATPADVPAHVAIPAFAISEFRRAFEMGCLLFIPFLLVDLVVSSILLSAGMMMLPPAMVSLPFKLILFVLVDGWRLVVKTLVLSFNG